MAGARINSVNAIEKGLYEEAMKAKVTLSEYLEQLAMDGEISDDLFDPTITSRSTGQPVSAFKQILRHAGIQLDRKGYSVQTGDLFTTNPANRVLFPEFISMTYMDAVRDMTANELRLADIVAEIVPTGTVDGTSSVDFKYGELQADGVRDQDMEFGIIQEGAELPTYLVRDTEVTVRALKYGGKLAYSYERIARARLSTIQRHMQKIARAQEWRKIKAALAVLLNGDGNGNAALNAATIGANFALTDMVGMKIQASRNGAMPNIVVGDDVEINSLVTLPQFIAQDATADNANTRDNGDFPTVYGFRPKLAPIGSILDGSKRLMAVDSNLGLTQFYDPLMTITEQMNWITAQLKYITMTEVVGWAKTDRFASFTRTRP